jgi:hypothetical protein
VTDPATLLPLGIDHVVHPESLEYLAVPVRQRPRPHLGHTDVDEVGRGEHAGLEVTDSDQAAGEVAGPELAQRLLARAVRLGRERQSWCEVGHDVGVLVDPENLVAQGHQGLGDGYAEDAQTDDQNVLASDLARGAATWHEDSSAHPTSGRVSGYR